MVAFGLFLAGVAHKRPGICLRAGDGTLQLRYRQRKALGLWKSMKSQRMATLLETLREPFR